MPTVLGSRHDAFVYLDDTDPLHPLHLEPEHPAGQTYPSAV